jgi:hypothetical protein
MAVNSNDLFHQCFPLCMQEDRASGRIETVNGGVSFFQFIRGGRANEAAC